MEKSRHDRLVDRVASARGGGHQRKGLDLKTRNEGIEIEVTESGVYHSLDQLRASRKECKYLAVPRELRDLAIKVTKGTGIGVMNGNGQIVKKCRKKGNK